MGYGPGLSWVFAVSLGMPALAPAAFRYFDPTDPGGIPPLLSQTGFYTDIANRTADTAAKPFSINSPLWSDGSLKQRWVILRPGRSIAWVDDTDFFDYPDSTVFVKTFLLARGPGDTVYWETRFFVKKADTAEGARNWWGFSYRWNPAQTDAHLVDRDLGANAVLAVKDDLGLATYRKWRFPAQVDCNRCHQVSNSFRSSPDEPLKPGRAVLGFFPAQLKKPARNGAGDQVLALFAAGVFSGPEPDAASLANRFIGMGEPIASNVTGSQRRLVIDKMARSFLAANCSGCHGDRGKEIGSGTLIPPNFDYFDLQPHGPPFHQIESTSYLHDTTSPSDSLAPLAGRNKYKWLVSSWGMGSDPNWTLALPPGNPDTMSTKEIYLDPATNKGYPALSKLLFRQWSRNTPGMDSAAWYQALKRAAGSGHAEAQAKLGWLFSQPWGSQAWMDNLAAHGFSLDSVMAGWEGQDRYGNDFDGMPPLATYIPDTAALRILGEWVVSQESAAGIRAGTPAASPLPYLRDRILVAPPGWTGKVRMLDIRGRVFVLESVGKGRYAIPEAARDGVYFFRFGQRTFKASILR